MNRIGIPQHESKPSDVDAARRDVERAERALSLRLNEASAVGRATLRSVLAVARPVLVGVALVAGAVWLARRFKRPRASAWLRPPPSERSVIAEATRAAALSLASAAARRVAERLLTVPVLDQSTPAGRADAPHSRAHPE
jgi:hypothetical protein